MKNVKLFSLLVALVMCFTLILTACDGGDTDETDDVSGKESETDTEGITSSDEGKTETTDDGKVTYTVKVTDVDGNPISGAAVQLCRDTCLPGSTDESGTVSFTVVEDDYKVSFLVVPTGYALAGDETEFYFEDGSYEMTLVLAIAE